tara:strand:- start:16115 stop:16591 length:477 start_codon:yes stop_codon:yes gene_type:complete
LVLKKIIYYFAEKKLKSKRRLFLKNVCAPVLFSIMGIPLIEACSKSEDSSDNSLDFASPPSSSGPIEIDIGSSKFNAIRSIGGWMNYVEENLLLIRITENDFRAFDNACPHQGVRNKWSYEDNTFTCSQHGNSFSNECGGGLKCYETTFKDNILTVTR